MNIIILDTETTDLTRCFCYDLGYRIMDTETRNVIADKHFVIEQIWHNLPLFESAYYKEKRQKYVEIMRKRKATLTKWGYAVGELRRDIKKYNVTDVYAYNSDFDDKVLAYNCDWFKCINPLENVAVHDIWGYASQFITNQPEYKAFCEKHERFTDTGNYKGSAEVVYQYITNNPDFVEEHMGLMDSDIESSILFHCVKLGAKWGEDYKVNKILARVQEKPFTVKVNGEKIFEGKYFKKYIRNDIYSFTTLEG